MEDAEEYCTNFDDLEDCRVIPDANQRKWEHAQAIRSLQTKLMLLISDYQIEHDLTYLEMLQTFHQWMARPIQHMIDAERNDP